MGIRRAIILVVGVGLGLFVVATSILASPTRKDYIVIELNEIIDADNYAALKKMGVRTTVEAQFEDGRYLANSDKLTALDGTAPKSIIIIAFDNETKAKEFYNNSKEITALRMNAAKSRAFIVEVCSEGGKLYPDC
jgi:uncharacterized protein (DUF1330 family)